MYVDVSDKDETYVHVDIINGHWNTEKIDARWKQTNKLQALWRLHSDDDSIDKSPETLELNDMNSRRIGGLRETRRFYMYSLRWTQHVMTL